ncbi:DUF6880 family protein [Sphingomonas elodea]|uniref:DUF6880 family protein n=1 Tax=Sphingomonas elodea TaxID=179878 RepID=UPI0002632237|nr:DUF6880 family protein [Sphingomonas elodea]
MASEKTLNGKNLVALGAERLAELLLELSKNDAAAKRRLRLELASRSGGGADVAAAVRKRLATIAKARSFVEWNKVRALAADLDLQRSAIVQHVAPAQPAEAFELLWQLLQLAPSVYARCDDSNGAVGTVIAQARDDLGTIAAKTAHAPDLLAERVFAAVQANQYGEFDGLIGLLAEALGKDGLAALKARFEALAALPPPPREAGDRRVIGFSTRGPIYQDDFEARAQARRIRSALTEIADALGDADGYAARFSAEEHTNPSVAAAIAERLLKADRPEAALAALRLAEESFRKGGHWPDWPRVRIDALDALGRFAEAQAARWAIFERSLDPHYLRAHLKRLADFEDVEAEDRALAHVRQYADFHHALDFLIAWPAHRLAAELVLARYAELDGDRYWLLTPAAEALEARAPLAATLMLRSMIDVSLDRAKHKRYGHAARHLQTCEHLAKRIDDFGTHPDHDAYAAQLEARHGRKSGFWSA